MSKMCPYIEKRTIQKTIINYNEDMQEKGNIQIYDRHIDDAKELLSREPIFCEPKIVIDDNVKSFDDMTQNNVRLEGYPIEEINKKNKKLKLEVAI